MMGFASKLAANQPPGAYNAPRPGQQLQGGYPPQLQAGQTSGGYSSQAQYPPHQSGHYPPQQSGQYPPQQSGQYQPQQQPQSNGQYGQQYGGPPPQASRQQSEAYKRLLQATIQQKSLQNMIPLNHPNLERYAQRAPSQIDQLCARWNVPREMGQDLAKLALYDVVLYIDNSGSMEFEQAGLRVQQLKKIITSVVYAATLFDDDGISIRFMNDWASNPAMDGFDMRRLDRIQNEHMVEQVVSKIRYVGLTPLGTELRNKVIDPLVLGPARAGRLQKPVLLITITDGQPAGEDKNTIFETIRYAFNELSRMPQYGPGAVSFQFAQVGDDQEAREFLAKLDSDPQVGQLVDCTSNYENEQVEMQQKTGATLTRALWHTKLLLGSIDSTYDSKDESAPQPSMGQTYGAPQPGPYEVPNGHAQQSYPAPQGNYGQPPQHNYGSPLPQQSYASPPYGHQVYGQPSQPGYGQAQQQNWSQQPPSQGYGQYKQQNYGGPPPPPRF
ncbi:MAG: hypothetical protein Q9210_002864 [Variospora velana]